MDKVNSSNRSRMLVAFFSRSGNTRKVAEEIAELTGSTIFEIVPATAYPDNYQAVVDQARSEIRKGDRPELRGTNHSFGDYDVIFIGSPNWINTIAPPVATFLADQDLSGKTVVPFVTHGGSGLGHSVDDIRSLCPSSEIFEAHAIIGTRAADSRNGITDWLQRIGIEFSK